MKILKTMAYGLLPVGFIIGMAAAGYYTNRFPILKIVPAILLLFLLYFAGSIVLLFKERR